MAIDDNMLNIQYKNTNTSQVDQDLPNLVNDIYPYFKHRLKFNKDPMLVFAANSDNAADPLGQTGYYNPNQQTITIFVTGRHIKDICRSFAHELIHHFQNLRGELETDTLFRASEAGYAQKDKHLRTMEKEAYELGNILFRDWEDGRKAVKTVKKQPKKTEKTKKIKVLKADEAFHRIIQRKRAEALVEQLGYKI